MGKLCGAISLYRVLSNLSDGHVHDEDMLEASSPSVYRTEQGEHIATRVGEDFVDFSRFRIRFSA